MVLFQIIFIAILLLEIGVGLAVKYNYNGLQDKLVSLFMRINIEDYIRYQFPDRWVLQMVFLLILFLLCL
jgi:hypothetical protein|nr:MAG TPA: hypothetical protein [Caudoviricetes sp.]